MKNNKRGQLEISFGMIFSIILIIIFISAAFYGITKFLGLTDTAKTAKFGSDLQVDVDKVWKGSSGSETQEYNLPKNIEAVCFTNQSEYTLNFKADYYIDDVQINHLNLAEMTKIEEPYCVPNINGKVKLIIEKDFKEKLVTIKEYE